MSTTDGVKAGAPARTMSRPQWLRANVAGILALVVRAPRVPPGTVFAWRTPPLRLVVGAIVVLLAILITMIAVDAGAISQARKLPAWIVDPFNQITDFGKSGWVLIPTALLLAMIALFAAPTLPKATRLVLTAISVRLVFLFVAVGLPGLIVTIGKRLIGRARPLIEGNLDPFIFRPFGWSPAYASMPSGHATNAFAAAVALGALWPRGRPLFWAYAVVIAISRVVITAHHPSDVLAGAVAGILGALVVRDWFATRRVAFVTDGAGGVRALPGPSWARIKRVARALLAP